MGHHLLVGQLNLVCATDFYACNTVSGENSTTGLHYMLVFYRLPKIQNLVKTVENVLNLLDLTQDLEDDDIEGLGINTILR